MLTAVCAVLLTAQTSVGASGLTAQAPGPEPLRATTADGVTVYGWMWGMDLPRDAPLLLLFHQGGANARGEYGPVAP